MYNIFLELFRRSRLRSIVCRLLSRRFSPVVVVSRSVSYAGECEISKTFSLCARHRFRPEIRRHKKTIQNVNRSNKNEKKKEKKYDLISREYALL